MSNHIGMLRASGTPGAKAKAMAYVAQVKGLDFYYFTVNDIDIEQKKINAYFLRKDQWIRKEIDYPRVIDNDVRSLKQKKICDDLSQYSYLTTQILGGKLKTTQYIQSMKNFEDIIIPYEVVKSEEQLRTFAEKQHYIVIKPIGGNQGKNIQFIQWNENNFVVNDAGHIQDYPQHQFSIFYERNIKGRNLICQKYVTSLTTRQQAFDLRIHVQRNGKCQWEISKIYARIGAGKALIANLSAGGSMADGKLFLKHNFPDRHEDIYNKVKYIGLNLPQQFQEFYTKEIDSLGIDLGIDEKGRVWLFEINSFPGSKYFEFERALTRIDYLKALLKTENPMQIVQQKIAQQNYKMIIDNRDLKEGNHIVFLKNKKSRIGMSLSCIKKNIDQITIVLYEGEAIEDHSLVQKATWLNVNHIDRFLMDFASSCRRRFKGNIYTVTGSVGKTSVSTLLAKMIKSIEKNTIINLKGNTPYYIANGLTQLQDELHAVFEVAGAGLIDQEAIGAISHQLLKPSICLFTMLAPAHIAEIGSLKAIAERKAAAFQHMPEHSILVINKDIEYFDYMMTFVPDHIEVYTYGMQHDADAKIIEHYDDHMLIEIDKIQEKIYVDEKAPELRLNYLGLISVLKLIFPERWKESLHQLNAVAKVHGRGKLISTFINNKKVTIVDESYNANPASMKLAIQNFNRIVAKRKIIVISEMLELGEYSLGYHQEILDLIQKMDVDKVILFGEIFKKMKIENQSMINVSNFDHLTDLLNEFVDTGASILFKGSNSTGLYKYVKTNFYSA